MSNALSISEVGLRLIKAYEGFRPVDVELVTGQRVAGYGHRVMDGESLHLTEKKAEKLLKRDLAPYEAMINDSIFAPLTQSQFDALCSLAFNVGPKKFLESDVVRALNNGRVLDAANGFDVWRKGEVNGESYVVDALVRRRTAEKVLFLRPNLRSVRAPRVELEAVADSDLMGKTTAMLAPVLEDSGLVPKLNFPTADLALGIEVALANEAGAEENLAEAEDGDTLFIERRNPDLDDTLQATPMRRRDDRPGGVLTLSEVYDEPGYNDDPLIKDLEGFTLDLNGDVDLENTAAPLELEDIVDYDDDILALRASDALSDSLADSLPDSLPIDDIPPAKDMSDYDETYDPSEYIVGAYGSETHGDGDAIDPIELEELGEGPSPIATAAAEVSGRLDALMAERDVNAPEEDKKILPFRAKTTPKTLDTKPLGETPKPREQEPLDLDMQSFTNADADADEDDNATSLASRNDSAARYIAKTIVPTQTKPAQTGLMLLVGIGMALLGACIGAMYSGFDQRFGLWGEFLSTFGALLGLMITLGSIYYILKNMRERP